MGVEPRRSIAARNAASVLPDPVGASSSVWSPAAMAGQPWAWAPVGAWKLASNQARVGAPKPSSGDSAITGHGTGALRHLRRPPDPRHHPGLRICAGLRLLPAVPVRDLLDRSPGRR